MINVLVPTKPDDFHAIYVKLALEKIGHRIDLWYTADFPKQQTHSFNFMQDENSWHVKGQECDVKNQYDIVWYRRPAKPIMPDFLHPEDVANARKENYMFYQSIWHAILPDATWVNPVNAATKGNSKLLQLKLASMVGLRIPNTLISNNPDDIKEYISKTNIIYKTLYPMAWLNKDDVRLTYTNQITMHDLPSDKILQCTPGIFQEKIEKKYELRVTYFGNKYIAVKIHSQDHSQAKMDWRSAPTKELKLEIVSLPDKIDQKCQSLMKKLGIVFGCFDFIVSPNEEYYFLEVNEQGQFLWIEDVNPEIKMLEAFTQFLLSYDSVNEEHVLKLSMKDFEKDALDMKNHAEIIHLNPGKF